MTPTYHLRGTPWPLSVSGPKFAVVRAIPPATTGNEVAWFWELREARDYIRLMENRMAAKEKRRKK